ncbi:MAG: hypothetical protein J5J06_14065 [Phycisphaerae bacterium]|nr:hypothetical protein [Phycisphaerae bacterium]
MLYAKAFERAGRSGSARLMASVRRRWAAWAGREVPKVAAREWAAFERAADRGIPTIRPVALAVQQSSGRSILITEGVPDASSLADFWMTLIAENATPAVPNVTTRKLTSASAELLARSHDRGFLHLDGHARNILVRGVAGGPGCLYADVHPVRFLARAVSDREAVRSLAQLDQFFHRVATRSQRLRFLKEYLRMRGVSDATWKRNDDLKRWAVQIQRLRLRTARRLATHRDRRFFRAHGKYFAGIDLPGGWSGVVACMLARRHVFPEADVPDRTIQDWRRLLDGFREAGAVQRPLYSEGAASGVRVSLLSAKTIGQRLAWSLLGSPARRAFRQAHRQRHRDLPAGLVLGYLEHRRFGLIDGAMVLHVDRSCAFSPRPNNSDPREPAYEPH